MAAGHVRRYALLSFILMRRRENQRLWTLTGAIMQGAAKQRKKTALLRRLYLKNDFYNLLSAPYNCYAPKSNNLEDKIWNE